MKYIMKFVLNLGLFIVYTLFGMVSSIWHSMCVCVLQDKYTGEWILTPERITYSCIGIGIYLFVILFILYIHYRNKKQLCYVFCCIVFGYVFEFCYSCYRLNIW